MLSDHGSCLGNSTCVFSALRIQAIATLDYSDLTYLAGVPSIYSVLEPTLAITLACVPVLRPLLGGKYSKTGTRLARAAKASANTTSSPKKSPGVSLRKSSRADRFETLGGDTDDDEAASDLQLQPIECKQHARVSARDHGRDEVSADAGSADGIVVTQGWQVNVV